MKNFGCSAVSEFLEDRIVYRNLAPVDPRLPSLELFREAAGLTGRHIPRKSEPDYARAIVYLLRRAMALESPEARIRRLIFIGDTRLNDGTAFANLCQAGGWPGLAFIGSETPEPPFAEVVPDGNERALYLANRWAGLADFDRFCAGQQFPVDEATAVIIDLDKTTLGARGRNAHVIDQARLQAVRDTVAGLLGGDFDPQAFEAAYNQLNQVAYHPFTTDNQDYLAYICLVLSSGLFDREAVLADIRSGRLASFQQFISEVDAQVGRLKPALAAIHAEIYTNVQAGDPTPFKAFRRNEYLTTVGRMGHLDDTSPVKKLLAEEILITQEVRELAQAWRQRGALLFGLSDKPDEASLPTSELAAQGYQPIHRTATHAVGEARRE